MELRAQILEVYDRKSGCSDYGQWYIQPIRIAFEENIPTKNNGQFCKKHEMLVDITGDLAKDFSLQAGTICTFYISFDVKVYGGKPYMHVHCKYFFIQQNTLISQT